MKSFINRYSISFIATLSVTSPVNAGDIEIDYNPDTNQVTINAQAEPLQSVLDSLSARLGFELDTNGQTLGQEVTVNLQGDSKTVIEQTIRPMSAAIAQSGEPPYKISRVILLPLGTEQSKFINKKPLLPPTPTGDANKDAKHMKHYERKLRQLDEFKQKRPPEEQPLFYTEKTKKARQIANDYENNQ